MKDSGVEWMGEIPEDWNTPKVINQFDLVGSGTTPKSYSDDYYTDGTINWIQSGDLHGKYLKSTAKKITQVAVDETSALKLYAPNYLVMAMYGASVGNLVISTIEACTNQACCVLAKEKGNLKYMYYVLMIAKEYLIYSAVGGTQPNISQNIIKDLRVPVPSLGEQQKIANFLDEKVGEIDSVIIKTKETIEDYKKYKQAIITDAVTKGLNPNVEMKESKLQWVDTIPRYWKENKISHIISMPVIDGPHVSPELVDNGVPFISADAIENGKINFDRKRGFITKEYSEECNKRYKPQKNDILVVKLGASTGKMAIVGDETNFNIWVPLAVVRCKVDILPQYIFYSMESSYFKNEIRNGWTFGTQETLGVKTLEQLKVFVPSLEEQKEIAEYLNEKCFEIDKLIAKKEELLADLEDYKKSLIYEYVTGKKEVE